MPFSPGARAVDVTSLQPLLSVSIRKGAFSELCPDAEVPGGQIGHPWAPDVEEAAESGQSRNLPIPTLCRSWAGPGVCGKHRASRGQPHSPVSPLAVLHSPPTPNSSGWAAAALPFPRGTPISAPPSSRCAVTFISLARL